MAAKIDKTDAAIMAIAIVPLIAICVVAYVAVHFIVKFW